MLPGPRSHLPATGRPPASQRSQCWSAWASPWSSRTPWTCPTWCRPPPRWGRAPSSPSPRGSPSPATRSTVAHQPQPRSPFFFLALKQFSLYIIFSSQFLFLSIFFLSLRIYGQVWSIFLQLKDCQNCIYHVQQEARIIQCFGRMSLSQFVTFYYQFASLSTFQVALSDLD